MLNQNCTILTNRAYKLNFLKRTLKLPAIPSIQTSIMCHLNFAQILLKLDRLCGLAVRVLGYRSGGPGSIAGTTRKKK
jgi:hypothetical protein